MKTTLDPWDIIGWLLLGTAALAVAAVILILLVMWQRALLTQYLIRRDWRRTRHVAPPTEPGHFQRWGFKHGNSRDAGVVLKRYDNGVLAFMFEAGYTWGGQNDGQWVSMRDKRHYTLISEWKGSEYDLR